MLKITTYLVATAYSSPLRSSIQTHSISEIDKSRGGVILYIFFPGNRRKLVLSRCFSSNINSCQNHFLSQVVNSGVKYSLAGTTWINCNEITHPID